MGVPLIWWELTSVWLAKTSNKPISLTTRLVVNPYLFVCLLQDASGHSNVLKAGKAEELKNARKRRTARKAN